MRHVRDVAACKRSNRARGGWTKSSLSMSNGHCVEVSGLGGGHIGIRDSKDRSGPVLQFTPDEWTAFLDGVGNGEFDDV
jgi:uncharacterized protein DUF397